MIHFHEINYHSSEVNNDRIILWYEKRKRILIYEYDASNFSDLFMARLQSQKYGPIRLERFKELVEKVCKKMRTEK